MQANQGVVLALPVGVVGEHGWVDPLHKTFKTAPRKTNPEQGQRINKRFGGEGWSVQLDG